VCCATVDFNLLTITRDPDTDSAERSHGYIASGCAAAEAPLHGQWNLREQQGADRETTGKLFIRAGRRDGAVPRRDVQFQPEPPRNVLASRRRREVAVNLYADVLAFD